jgi:hypothetical protein
MTMEQTMTPQMWAGLLNHTFQAGQTALQRRDPYRAGQWYAQCLIVLKNLGKNEEWISVVLYYYAHVLVSLNQHQHAIACLAASVNIQHQFDRGEAEADCFYASGSTIADLDDPATAAIYLREALQRYQELHLQEKIAETDEQLRKVTEKRPKNERELSTMPKTFEFEIVVDQEVIEKFSVSAVGIISWHTVPECKKSVAFGLVNTWQVRCTNLVNGRKTEE